MPRPPRTPFVLHKPHGPLVPRARAVGAGHRGIAAVDGAQARSRYGRADFYGRTLPEPATRPPTRGDLRAAGDRARPARRPHDRRDLVVAVQRTGEYHRPVPAAARAAGFATRLVHPLTAKQYRPPADPGSQTDDTDRAALGRAAAHGFGRCDPPGPDR